MDSNPIHHPSAANKMKCFFLDYVHFWWSARLVDGLKPHLAPLSSQRNKMLIFVLHSTSDVGQTGQWTQSPSTAHLQPKKWNASFMDYTQLLMIGRAEWWTQTPSAIPSPANKMKCFFLDYVHFWWCARLVDGLKPHLQHLSSQKNEMLTFGLCSLWMISQAGQWTQTPSTTPLHPKKWNAHFWVMFNFWWLVGLFDELKPHLPPLSSQ